MDKPKLQSKTVWGVLVFTVVTLLTQLGIVDSSTITQLLQTLSGALTAFGIRDAI